MDNAVREFSAKYRHEQYVDYITWKPAKDYVKNIKVGDLVHIRSHKGTFRIIDINRGTVKVTCRYLEHDYKAGVRKHPYILTVRSNIHALYKNNGKF